MPGSSPIAPDGSNSPRTRPWLRWLCGCVLAYMTACGVWIHHTRSVPDVFIPTPRLPVPNAFDFYVKSGNMVVPKLEQSCMGLMPADSLVSANLERASHETRAGWFRRHAAVLGAVRQGFGFRYAQPPSRSLVDQLPYLVKFRELARVFAAEARTLREAGQWSVACESGLDIIRFGGDVPRGGPLRAAITGYAIQAIGRDEVWKALPHLDAVVARRASARLKSLNDTAVPIADTLQEEKWSVQAGLLEIMRSDHEWMMLDGLEDARLLRWHDLFLNNRAIIDNYSRLLDVRIANGRTRYNVQPQPLPALQWSIGDPLTSRIYLDQSKARIKSLSNEAGNDLLLVALALRAFRLEHGAYPPKLAELVPRYLSHIPADPFGGGEPLRYQPRPIRHVTAVTEVQLSAPGSNGYPGGGSVKQNLTYGQEPYTLYSIGPDGVDNGGKAVDAGTNDTRRPTQRYRVDWHSQGDIVAGVNQ